MSRINRELYIKYNGPFIASQSDFVWDSIRRCAFGGCILATISQHYHTVHGLLAMSNGTYNSIKGTQENDGLVLNPMPVLSQFEECGDYRLFTKEKTGQNIGDWLDQSHRALSVYPSHVISHTIDEAANGVLAVEIYNFQTREERPRRIVSTTCHAHKAATSGNKGQGTSSHKRNLNPDAKVHLTKLHTLTVSFNHSGPRKKVIERVHQEEGRVKYSSLQPSVPTRWGSRHKEASRANENQYDFNIGIRRIIAQDGIDKEVFQKHMKEHGNIDGAILLQENWDFLQQYEGGFQVLQEYIVFCQHLDVRIHEELIRLRGTLSNLSRPYFEMWENVSKRRGDDCAKDLTDRPLNQLVVASSFEFMNDSGDKYLNHNRHMMLDTAERGRRITYRELATRTELFKRCDGDDLDLDADIASPLSEGLEDMDELPLLMAVGCLCNPLMQNTTRIIKAGLMTEGQAEHAVRELLTIMEQYYEGKVGKEMTSTLTEHMEAGNEYSSAEDFRYGQETPKKKAIGEYDKYRHWCLPLYQPVMEANTVIGDVDDDGQPEKPVYVFGKVIRRGKDLPNGTNLADYVDEVGHFDALGYVLVQFLLIHLFLKLNCILLSVFRF